MANDLPYMPLWIDDWLIGTQELPYTERGFYITLLCLMWRAGGSLPDDDIQLARLLYCDVRTWRRIRVALEPHLLKIDGKVSQKYLQSVLNLQREKRDKAAAAAATRWKGKGGRKSLKSNDQADAFAMQTDMHPHMPPQMRSDMRSHDLSISQPEPKEPKSKGDFGSGSPLPPESAGQSPPPRRVASPSDAARSSAASQVESQAAFVAANRPDQPAAEVKPPPVSSKPLMQPTGIDKALADGRAMPPGLLSALKGALQPMPLALEEEAPSPDYQPPAKPSEVPPDQLRAMDDEQLRQHFADLHAEREAEREALLPKRLTPQRAAPAPAADPKQHASPSLMAALKAKREEDERNR